MWPSRTLIVLISLTILVLPLACGDDTIQPTVGFVRVGVYDMGVVSNPVADVDIAIQSMDIAKRTNAEGIALFELNPGNYIVDANVCCVGPGFIEYHVPVIVTAGQTVEVRLNACLACVCKVLG